MLIFKMKTIILVDCNATLTDHIDECFEFLEVQLPYKPQCLSVGLSFCLSVCLYASPKSVRKMSEKIISSQNAIFTHFIIFHHATLK